MFVNPGCGFKYNHPSTITAVRSSILTRLFIAPWTIMLTQSCRFVNHFNLLVTTTTSPFEALKTIRSNQTTNHHATILLLDLDQPSSSLESLRQSVQCIQKECIDAVPVGRQHSIIIVWLQKRTVC
jgi:hypothetical protein